MPVTQHETAAQILLRGLIEDAGLFPPTALRMLQAVERHRTDRIVAHPMLAHRFLCPSSRWPELLSRLNGGGRIDVGLTLDSAGLAGGPPEPDPRIRIAHYETRARPKDLRMAADLFRSKGMNGRERTAVYFEIERVPGWLNAVAALSGARPLGAKIHCSDPHASVSPSPAELGEFITACVVGDVPFTVGSGWHRAAGHIDPRTGFRRYGYLNLLLATATAVDFGHGRVQNALTSTDEEWLAAEVASVAPSVARRTRELFVGYGSCSTGDPMRDAARLGLLGSWEV
ncbi:MAG: hypothetical protein M0026_19845 [Nocardiopsaceae bacterium]|nr:hypothetical protein [Nocardiopsaceae bacterium]